MTKLLLSSIFHALKLFQVQNKPYKKSKSQKILVTISLLIVLLTGNTVFGQIEVDTWYSADRAVNSAPTPNGSWHLFTPLAPGDGTTVTTWYDLVDWVDADKQDAIGHPSINLNQAFPDGFDYPFPNSGPYNLFLAPTGSTPGLPTLRRNDMNFNPSIEFDGSNEGDALVMRSVSRDDITVFIVFRAEGAGNTAETQRLLFGGDVDAHHSSVNVEQRTTNLSLGVSDGNRFSIGRTWLNDGGGVFQSGTIDLEGKPTIGVFTRDALPLSFQENLDTFVNGIHDISVTRGPGFYEANSLFFFNSIGKHFNSNDPNRNLTGNIAEILLADGALDPTSITQAQSYLAIKYGITLNNSGALGSVVGNQGFTYLAADGTTIWDPTINPNYRFDIAGLARDRYQDDGPDLRYNLHQRIAKSENDEAIVTMSTDSNFTTDNLDQTRPEIDNYPWAGTSPTSYRHNYLIWGNDHAGLDTTNVELPVSGDIVTRIPREWQVQKTFSAGVDPIYGVSLRFDLSGSNILPNDACRIHLMIDRDGNGDFSNGTVDLIMATSADSQYVFFDDVDFEHLDVFSIGLKAPLSITVVDSTPPSTCGGSDGEIQFAFTNVPDGNYTITYDEGTFPNVTVSGGTATVTGLSEGKYSNLKITANGCTSQQDPDVVLSSPDAPTIAAVAVQPSTCGASDGQIQFTFENVPNDTYDIIYDDGIFSDVDVNSNAAIVTGLPEGNYSNLTITVGSCASQQNPDIVLSSPDAPTIAAVAVQPTTCGANDGEIQFTFENVPNGDYTISYDGGSFPNVTVSGGIATVENLPAGNYTNLNITVNSCTSQQDPDIVLSSPDAPTIVAVAVQPSTCGASDGEIEFTFANVPDGDYTITYDGGSFPNVTVASNAATVTGLAAGNYSNLTIAVGSCSSQQDPDVVLSSPDAPTIEAVAVQPSTCGASDGEIQFTFANVPDGDYTIAYDGGSFPNVTVSGGTATVEDLPAGNYSNLTISVNSCTSQQDPDVVLSSPDAPTIAVVAVQPSTCGASDGQIQFTFTNVPDGNYTITYDGGSFPNVAVASNAATVSGLAAGNYSNLTIAVASCTSQQDPDVVLSSPDAPTIEAVAVQPSNCGANDGEIQFTFTNVPDGDYDITHDNGTFTDVTISGGTATVEDLPAGNYNNLTIAVGSCSSQQDPDIVLSSPDAPTIAAVAVQPSTCGASDGEIEFTFENVPDGDYTIAYDGGSFPNVTVSGGTATVEDLPAGNYSNLSISVGSCASQQDPDIVLSSPDAPTIEAVAVQPSTCGASDGQIQFTFTNVPDGNHTISYDGGSFANVAVSGGTATVSNLAAGNYNNLTIAVGSCASQQDPDVVLSSPDAPTIEAVAVQPSTCGASDG
ncbi:hypothetical protein GUA46_07055, partial [Muricauda sp. HICW]